MFTMITHKNKMVQSSIFIILLCMITACHPDIEQEIKLHENYQVLGIQVDPPVVRPEDTITLTAYDHHPFLNSLKYNWQIC